MHASVRDPKLMSIHVSEAIPVQPCERASAESTMALTAITLGMTPAPHNRSFDGDAQGVRASALQFLGRRSSPTLAAIKEGTRNENSR